MRPLLSLPAFVIIFALFAPRNYCFGQAATRPSFTREGMLRDLAASVLAPGWREVASRSRDLTNSIALLAEAPSRESLDNARSAWLAVAQATTRLRCFQAGPLADRGYASAFYYWQTLPPRIETVIASSEPVNQPLLDKFGATSKGLFTLEYLLFDRPGLSQPERAKAPAALALLSGTNAQRRTAYLRAVARDVELKAGQLADDWAAPGEQGASARFAAGGHESVNLAVNQLAAAMEYEAERHLRFVLVLPKPISDQLNRIERTPSASSLQGVLESLEGGQKLFCGGDGWGLRDALKRVNAPVEKRVYDQFQAAIAATRSLGRPLEEAAANDRASLQKAFDQVRSLEILIKVDVASALGVTLTFGSNDGD